MRYKLQIRLLVTDDWWNVFEKPACGNNALFVYLFHIQLTLLNCISFHLASSHVPRVVNVWRCLAALGVLFQHKQTEVTSLESDKAAGVPSQWRGGWGGLPRGTPVFNQREWRCQDGYHLY